jgi:hypothetical protein
MKVIAPPLPLPLSHYLCFVGVVQQRFRIIDNPNLNGVARYQKDKKRRVDESLVFSNSTQFKVLINVRSAAGDYFHASLRFCKEKLGTGRLQGLRLKV